MRTTAALKATAMIGAAVLLALLSGQGTLALWSVSAASPEAAVQTADFAVTVITAGGGAGRLSAGTVTVPGATGLLPGTSRSTAITVTNATDAGSGTFRTRITAGAAQVLGALAGYLTASIARAQGSDCSTVQAGTSLDLAQNASGTLCLITTLAQDAPATLGGGEASVTVALTAQQL